MLTEDTFISAVEELANSHADLAAIYATYGPPPFFAREPGFSTLVLMILEQQVSLASARAAYEKMAMLIDDVTPANFLTLDDEQLLSAGVSRQKRRYSRIVAEAVLSGQLPLDSLHELPDDDVRRTLTALTGIGPWTADVYLLMCLRRPDVWPGGDLALQVALQEIKGLEKRPTAAETVPHAEQWRPWRAVAARLLWHYYLSRGK